MKRDQVRAYRDQDVCRLGHSVTVWFTLPDYGDAPALFQCPGCGAIISIHPEAEHYVGPTWDVLRVAEPCPQCARPLIDAEAYPDHFRCPDCGDRKSHESHVGPYPPDDESVVLDCWNPYRT